MPNNFVTLSVVIMLLVQSSNAGSPSGGIALVITNLKNDRGQVGCRLFDSDKGFPIDEKSALQVK